jgi:hypothetical protein
MALLAGASRSDWQISARQRTHVPRFERQNKRAVLPLKRFCSRRAWNSFGRILNTSRRSSGQKRQQSHGFSAARTERRWQWCGGNERYFIQAATRLAALLRQRFILFAPTHHYMTGLILGILRSHDAAFFTLEANVRLNGSGRLQLLRKELRCDPAELRRHSAHLESLTNHLHDSRARHIRVRAAMEIEEAEEA